jgi:hypothetical protein
MIRLLRFLDNNWCNPNLRHKFDHITDKYYNPHCDTNYDVAMEAFQRLHFDQKLEIVAARISDAIRNGARSVYQMDKRHRKALDDRLGNLIKDYVDSIHGDKFEIECTTLEAISKEFNIDIEKLVINH